MSLYFEIECHASADASKVDATTSFVVWVEPGVGLGVIGVDAAGSYPI